MLWRVLRRLQRWTGGAPPVVQGLDAPDDAAIIAPPPDGHVSVQAHPNPLPPLQPGGPCPARLCSIFSSPA